MRAYSGAASRGARAAGPGAASSRVAARTLQNAAGPSGAARPSAQQLGHSVQASALPDFATVQPAAYAPAAAHQLQYETDARGQTRIKYQSQGWNYWDWEWQGEQRRVHYLRAGQQGAPVVVLVHGYGASSYHWRYNIPALADAGYQVYAIDLLGFGYSEKARIDYTNGRVWAAQVGSFIRQVVDPEAGPVVLAGNSLGGYVSLATAASEGPELVRGVVLLNGAGPVRPTGPNAAAAEAAEAAAWQDQSWIARAKRSVQASLKRSAMWFAFWQTKQPARIREVLQMVYVDPANVDDDLVASIENPALDPAAPEVFFLVSHNTAPPVYVESLLERLRVPLLLLWGDRDPWITPARAERILSLYPDATKVGLNSGHCPHDDTPAPANAALLDWLARLPHTGAGTQQGAVAAGGELVAAAAAATAGGEAVST